MRDLTRHHESGAPGKAGTLRSLLMLGCVALVLIPNASGQDYAPARLRMVEEQIQRRGVRSHAVLRAMRTVPRHQFVPPQHRSAAYDDRPLPIGFGQTISQPYIVAYMTEMLQVRRSTRVLEVGTGSGYQAAVLAEIADTVFTMEIVPELAAQASERLGRLGYTNVNVRQGDGYNGWPSVAPFDAIIVTAAAQHIPPPLIQQLADGGRMIIPVGTPFLIQSLMLVEKRGEQITTRSLMPVRFVPFRRAE